MQDLAYLGWHRRDWMKPHVGKEASGAGFHADLLVFREGHPTANSKQEILNHLPLFLPQKKHLFGFCFPATKVSTAARCPAGATGCCHHPTPAPWAYANAHGVMR